jgi:hypothetical protein
MLSTVEGLLPTASGIGCVIPLSKMLTVLSSSFSCTAGIPLTLASDIAVEAPAPNMLTVASLCSCLLMIDCD